MGKENEKVGVDESPSERIVELYCRRPHEEVKRRRDGGGVVGQESRAFLEEMAAETRGDSFSEKETRRRRARRSSFVCLHVVKTKRTDVACFLKEKGAA